MKDLLTKLIGLLVDDSSTVPVNETIQENTHNLEITCNPDQIGRLIGKGGHNIRALRTLLNIKGIVQGKQVIVKLLEPAV